MRFFLAGLITLAACAHAPLGPDSLKGRDYAVIHSLDHSVRIARVDGHHVKSMWKEFTPAGTATELQLSSGDHVLSVLYFQSVKIASSFQIKLHAEAGHVYLINDEPVDQKFVPWQIARVWIIDQTSVSTAGEILASINEPITRSSPPFSQSLFFAWRGPEAAGWTVVRRNIKQLFAAASAGPSENETENVSIAVIDTPTFEKPEEMRDFFTKRLRDLPLADPNRSDHLEVTVKPMDSNAGACIQYHESAVNRHPETDPYADSFTNFAEKVERGFRDERPMFVDLRGYVCRLPKNANLAIDFRYSRWSYERQDEASLMASADQLYKRLTF